MGGLSKIWAMGKVLRRLAGVATVASVGFFLGLCGMWVRSHVVRDYGWVWAPWPGDSSGRRWVKLDGDSGGGQVEVSWRVWTQGEREALRGRNELAGARAYHRTFAEGPRRYARSDPPTFWNRLGFKSYGGATHSSVCFPYWSAALLTAASPTWRMVAGVRRRQRVRAGLCPECGYDLRASPERCPECGREWGARGGCDPVV